MIAGIEYLVSNWITYILLIPFMLAGALLWNWWTDLRESQREARRDAQRRQLERKAAEADRDTDEENE